MVRAIKRCVFLVITLMVAFVLTDAFPNRVSGQVQPITEVEEKLQDISDIEQTVLEELFTLSQQIDEMRRQEKQVIADMEKLQAESVNLEKEIQKKQKSYDRQLSILERLLVSYQRNGPVSYVETIISAENLTDFIQSLNLIRELSRNTGDLLAQLDKSKVELAVEKENLILHTKRLEESRERLEIALESTQRLKDEQEAILDTLADEKEIYQSELNNLQQLWTEIKVLFSEILVHFTHIIERGEFPVEDLNLRLHFLRMSGTIYDRTLNDILKNQPELPQMIFRFSPEGIIVEIPEKHLVLQGEFTIVDKNILQFEVSKGSFYGMPLTESSIGELFRQGPITINFKELVGNVMLESVEIFDGYLNFMLAPDFS